MKTQITVRINSDDLAAIRLADIVPHRTLGQQAALGTDGELYTYVTAADAARIAEAWQQVAAELAEREQAAVA